MAFRSASLLLLALVSVPACGPAARQQSGMARVTFEVCTGSPGGPERFTVCTTNAAFVEEAARLLATGERRIPDLDLVDGGGCDAQWTWHVDPATPVFYDVVVADCHACPSLIEAYKDYWVAHVKRYCPWIDRVVAVNR